MCGIIGCISKNANELLLYGLNKMRYRGYDSCGIAYKKNDTLKVVKSLDEPETLKFDKISFGIGHTRWATNGSVSINNAHPIASFDNSLMIVHNGIVENALSLKNEYLNNITLSTDTDTEVLANIIAHFKKNYSTSYAISKALELITGANAFLIIFSDSQDIYYASKGTRLVYSFTKNEHIIASDALALPKRFKNYYYLPQNTCGRLSNIKKLKNKVFYENKITNDNETADYLFKEIKEEINVLKIIKDNIKKNPKILEITKAKKIIFVASGSSYNASLLASSFLNDAYKIECIVKQSSEFIYDEIQPAELYIFVSQSGQTADTLKAASKIKESNKVITITNCAKSALATIGNYNFDLALGNEVSVASTKAYLATVYLFYLLAYGESHHFSIASSIEHVFNSNAPKTLAKMVMDDNYIILLGKNNSYYVSLEAMLKIKELSYTYVDTYYSGELKHGPLALCKKGIKVIMLSINKNVDSISRSNLKEAISRGVTPIVISSSKTYSENDFYTLMLSDKEAIFEAICFYQLFAYYLAKHKNNNPDRPRNLAKSVTVE